jgi:hypothetical protein
MSDLNKTVASEAVKLLKETGLIPMDEKNIENKISTGTIKENNWKIIFEQQIRNLENQQDETK